VSLTEPALHHRPTLECGYSTRPAAELLARDDVLALVSSGSGCRPGSDPRHYHCGLPSIAGAPLHEVWHAGGPVTAGRDGDISWSCSEGVLFAATWIDEHPPQRQEAAVHDAYRALLQFVARRQYNAIVRLWNYLPHINQGEGDSERYRRFCLGRQRAFNDLGFSAASYPAACALGHQDSRSIIYLLAARDPVTHIENPLQQSAYHYPRQYGPASPSFARATRVDWAGSSAVFVSGTASILGHETRHAGNLAGQLQTTLGNLDAVLARCGEQAGPHLPPPRMNLLKVYLRHASDLAAVRDAVQRHFPQVPAAYLRGDICRRDLLVEIDGLASFTACEQGAAIAG